jgi:hypothetical protein
MPSVPENSIEMPRARGPRPLDAKTPRASALSSAPVLPHLQMMQLATGHFRAQAIYVAAKLGVADLLKDGARTCDELSRSTQTPPRALYRLLRALASIGVFVENDGGRFALTPLAETLRSDEPDSLRPLLLLIGDEFHWGPWSHLLYSVTTGECAFEHIHDQRFFEYLAENREAGDNFAAWMTRATEIQIPAILAAHDFAGARTVVDVGGGQGRLLGAILQAHPRLSGILFDRPEVVDQSVIEGAGFADRCALARGSFFDAVPRGGDLYLLKTVLHDWGDELALKILRNCRDAMTGDARLLVMEMVVPVGNEPQPSKFMDLNMLILNHGGMERTAEEFRALFLAADLEMTEIIATRSPLSLIECRRRD